MAATAVEIAQLRRMVGEVDDTTYQDVDLGQYIEQYPMIDYDGLLPDNADWTPTYDINAAASSIWAEKAATLASDFDFSADGGSYQRSQAYSQAMKQSRYYGSRRKPGVIVSQSWPQPMPTDFGEE